MPRSPYSYEGDTALFRDPATGRFISRATVRSWIDQGILKSQNVIQSASEDYRAGRITLDVWQEIVRTEVKRVHIGAELLARGGRSQMGPSDWGRTGQRIRVQYRYLAEFARELRDGTIRTDGSFLARVRMYAATARGAFHESERDVLADAGYTRERNLLGHAEHCEECIEETRRGWVPIGSLTAIGSRTCLANDKCSVEYS